MVEVISKVFIGLLDRKEIAITIHVFSEKTPATIIDMQRVTQQLGPLNAPNCFYLPNPPRLPQEFSTNALEPLIELNGNHWRKIIVIMAKIIAPNNNWRAYRNQLLQQNESIVFAQNRLNPKAKRHFICGQQSALALGLPPLNEPKSFDNFHWRGQQVYLLPYLDYRQCPNIMIDVLRQQILTE